MRLYRTGDGSLSLLHPRHGEGYHPREGARTQAERLYLEASGVAALARPRVLEVGFGLGLNFAVTLARVRERGGWLDYRAVEAEPAPWEAAAEVMGEILPELPVLLGPYWGRSAVVAGGGFRLELLLGRVERWAPPACWADAVYFDPFSPRANPEVWTPGVFARMYRALKPGGVLVTYSVAGRVRRGLEQAGFEVERIPAWGRKRHWLRARKSDAPPHEVEEGHEGVKGCT
ncbi:tRNA (5-methylaminomethyl-2-thiouridine)(34)-methyltransferase MnmD [Oceanithermus sp.]|uniref:tRNA (5-methylaminomethyl-2-thiouridine)(34)-methyltransferase MnmD n=1 Tax=Oceanithermus sp. TaxID=2268145 RepID=UPI0025FA44B5|nr:tRNA (5-methylaminomethyl-2-thiouridine)(34)-methyltransferase MnmD [Oceanithermus sp.]